MAQTRLVAIGPTRRDTPRRGTVCRGNVRSAADRATRLPDRGAATVEAAIALGAIVVVLVLALSGVVAVFAQLRCTDAAREAARLVARGEADRATNVVRQIAPAGARLTVGVHGDEVSVEVTAEPAGGFLPGVHLRAQAFSVLEPDAPDAAPPVVKGRPAAVGDASEATGGTGVEATGGTRRGGGGP